jgi:hypothetical protein
MSSWKSIEDNPYLDNWWDTGEVGADIDLEEDSSLISLRKLSRAMVKNNFIAASAQLAYTNSILGGLLKVTFLSKVEKLKKECERYFGYFKNNTDISRNISLSEVTENIINAAFVDGDVLINLPIDNEGGANVRTYIELVEANRIKTPPKHKKNKYVSHGVHYYSSGKVKGYWVISRKSSLISNFSVVKDEDFEFLPRYKKSGDTLREVCRLFKAPLNLRPNQSRQIPILSSVMNILRYFNQILETILIDIRVSACFSIFIKTNNPAGSIVSTSEVDNKIQTKGKRLTKIQPAMITYLKTNESIEAASPNKPSDNIGDFILRLTKLISMSLRIPYEHLFLDFSEASYSSARAGSLEVRRNVDRWRRDLKNVLNWIIITVLKEGKSKGKIRGDLKNVTIQINFPAYGTLDEEKMARANKTNLTSFIKSKHELTNERSKEYAELIEELRLEALEDVEREAEVLKRKKELEDELGIVFESSVKVDRKTKLREGEGKELDEEEKKQRRKEDGNW